MDKACGCNLAPVEAVKMPDYRIYTINKDGKIAGVPRVATCDSDQQAIDQAKQLLDGHDIEVWESARVVIRLQSLDK